MQAILFAFVLLFGISCAQETNTILFIEGFAEGLEVEIGNPAVCGKDVNATLDDFETGYSLIKEGIRHISISKVEAGLKDWSAGVNMLSAVLADCGAEELAADIEKLVAEFSSGASGIIKWLAHEIINIIDNDLYHLFRSAITDFENGQYYNAGVSTGKIVGILLSKK
eukprot:TRINITY_DN14866_c0_g1_i1.p1 TRINITY_DN14866_c0_g1~~TRINITY_DN14866_c0_g1_i1.p1  ORF type:complete len:168 (-),score=49.19 TRINITY_DN14866_c0_g1_i1:30-533(-)